MAENNEYHIYIHLDELEQKSAVAGTGTGSTGVESTETSAPAAGNGAAMLAAKAKSLVSFAAVASTADKLVSYNISQVSLQTGAVEYEQRLSAAYSLTKQFVGAGAALATGAIMGGAVGFTVAAMGVVTSVTNKLISWSQAEQTLRTQQSLENISIGMQNVRAGTTGRRSSEQ